MENGLSDYPDTMRSSKVVILFGSHRRNGNSEKVLELFQSHPALQNAEINSIFLMDKKIQPCLSCYECFKHPECVLQDDVKAIVDQMIESDMIFYVPVVYAFSIGSIFQAFLERAGFGYLRPYNRPLKDKLATVIVIGRRYGHDTVAAQVIMNILLNEMIIIGSGFLPLLQGVEKFPGNIMADEEGLDSFDKNVQKMADWYEKIGGYKYEYSAD